MTAGHADHFLSRLDRVTWQQMEYALALYNDAPMLQHILSRVKLAPDAERVALSLDHTIEGPFVIVTRDAKFVTCLKRGMKPTGLSVVERSRIDAIIERRSAFNEASKVAASAANGDLHEGVFSLFKRVFDAGPMLSREEISLLAVLAPIVVDALFEQRRMLLATHKLALDGMLEYAPALRRDGGQSFGLSRLVSGYAKAAYSLGHMVVLFGEAFARDETLDDAPDGRLAEIGEFFLAAATHDSTSNGRIRATWATARVGKPLLSTSRRLWHEYATAPLVQFAAGLALLATGTRHRKLRAEAFKPMSLKGERTSDPNELVRRIMSATIDEDEGRSDRTASEYGRLLWAALTGMLPEPTPHDVERQHMLEQIAVAQVDEDPAMAMLATLIQPYAANEARLTELLYTVRYFARRPIEAMYLPRATMFAHRGFEELTRTAAVKHVLSMAAVRKRGAEANETRPRAGRNEPCPCGSQKKFKKCCGA